MPFSPESERGLHFIAQSIGKEQTNLQIKQTDNDDDDVTTKTTTTNTFLGLHAVIFDTSFEGLLALLLHIANKQER